MARQHGPFGKAWASMHTDAHNRIGLNHPSNEPFTGEFIACGALTTPSHWTSKKGKQFRPLPLLRQLKLKPCWWQLATCYSANGSGPDAYRTLVAAGRLVNHPLFCLNPLINLTVLSQTHLLIIILFKRSSSGSSSSCRQVVGTRMCAASSAIDVRTDHLPFSMTSGHYDPVSVPIAKHEIKLLHQ